MQHFSKLQGCSSKIELAKPFSMLNFFSQLACSSVLLHALWRYQKMILRGRTFKTLAIPRGGGVKN